MFRRFGVEINYGHRQLTLTEASKFTPPSGATAITFELDDGIPTSPALWTAFRYAGAWTPARARRCAADLMLIECVPEELLDHEDDEPHEVADDVVNHAHRLLRSGIAQTQWGALHEAITAWVCEHRAAAEIRDHE